MAGLRCSLKLDDWQEEVMATKGNMCLRSGRQVGKSTVIGLKTAKFALEHHAKLIMVISKTERQAALLFSKILFNLHQIDKTQILKGKDRPTKHKIMLKNKSVIHCLPAGDTGYGIMGFTIDLLIADEAAFIPEEVWNSIIPALAITRGDIWLLSTPFIKEGYYYQCFSDPTFTAFHQSSEDCPRKDEVFLEHKRKTLTKAQYAQMYLGEFVDEFRKLWATDLINQVCILKRRDNILRDRQYYLGVDIARMGEDASTFEILDATNIFVNQVENIVTKKTLLTETEDKILQLDRNYDFGRRSIGIDDAGVGAGVFDALLRNNQVKRKIVGLTNARRNIDTEEKTKLLLKEEMYNTLTRMMERGEIKLLDDDEVKASLNSMQYEYTDKGDMRISGIDSHIAEGLVRAAYLTKNKSLNIYIY